MNTFHQSSRVAQTIATFLPRIPLKPVEFAPGEVATQSESVSILPPGSWLRVQSNQCTLVTFPFVTSSYGKYTIFPTGEHYLKWSAGAYILQHYDLGQQTSAFPEIRSVSLDALDVLLRMEVFWRVKLPLLVMNIPRPREVVESICRSTTINFIRTKPHDELVSTPSATSLATAEIAEQIRSALNANETLKGFEIMAVLIVAIEGDRRRTDVVQRSNVRKTEIDQERMIQLEQARLAGERLQLEQNFVNQSQALAIKKSETKRLEAEEEERIRLRKAEITSIEAQTVRDAQIQAVKIQQLAEMPRMQHEQIMKAMEVRGQAFGQIASAIFQMASINGGIQRGSDGNNQDTLVRALEALANMPAVSFGTTPMLPEKEANQPLSLRERIRKELHEVQKLPGTEKAATKATQPGFEQVELHYLNLRIFVICDENYPAMPPVQIEARRNGDLNYKTITLEWYEGMNLRQVALEVASKLLSSTYFEPAPKKNGNGNGHELPKSIVVWPEAKQNGQ